MDFLTWWDHGQPRTNDLTSSCFITFLIIKEWSKSFGKIFITTGKTIRALTDFRLFLTETFLTKKVAHWRVWFLYEPKSGLKLWLIAADVPLAGYWLAWPLLKNLATLRIVTLRKSFDQPSNIKSSCPHRAASADMVNWSMTCAYVGSPWSSFMYFLLNLRAHRVQYVSWTNANTDIFLFFILFFFFVIYFHTKLISIQISKLRAWKELG